MFIVAYNIKLSDCKDVIDYISRYQIIFDKLFSLISVESWMFSKNIEMTLYKSFL